MFDIGLEVIRPKHEVPVDWSVEQGIELTNDILNYADAISNIITVRRSIRKYGKLMEQVKKMGDELPTNVGGNNEEATQARLNILTMAMGAIKKGVNVWQRASNGVTRFIRTAGKKVNITTS